MTQSHSRYTGLWIGPWTMSRQDAGSLTRAGPCGFTRSRMLLSSSSRSSKALALEAPDR